MLADGSTTLDRETAGPTATGSGRDLPNLDVLRAVAVLSVVVSHTLEVSRPGVPLGYYGSFGVGIFFIHTALVLMGSLQRRPNPLDFYVRRAARIYPLAIVVMLFVLVTHSPVTAFHGSQVFLYAAPSLRQVLTNLLLVQNLFSGYNLVYVMWSLPLEVQMYLLLPVLFFFLQRYSRLWILLALWVIVLLFSAKEFSGVDLNLVFAGCFFLPGVMAFVGFGRWRPRLPGWTFPLAVLAAMAVGGHMRTWLHAAPVALCVGLALPLFHSMRPSFVTRAAWQVARYSYSIYLLHPLCLVLVFHLLPPLPYAVQLALLAASIAALSIPAYHLIEAPGIRLGGRVAARFA